jgi:hypothetical protein
LFISSHFPNWHLPALQIKNGPSPCSIEKCKREEILANKSHSLTRSLWFNSIQTRSQSAGAPCLYLGGKEAKWFPFTEKKFILSEGHW